MNIGLVDIDSHNFPNLSLMKLSAWHKSKGDSVFLLKPADILNGQNLFLPYDEVFGACVFDWNRSIADNLSVVGVKVGGTGAGTAMLLPDEVEHTCPDYSLYGIEDVAYGFLTRGCPRACPFCIVANKEGRASRKVADLDEFWHGEKEIKLLDPNLLACPDHMSLLQQLEQSKAWIDFTQGIDARLLNDENTQLLNKLKIKTIHFAWDNPKDEGVKEALLRFAKTSSLDIRHRRVYVLANYWSTHEQDLERIEWLRANDYDPYLMVYDKANAPLITRRLQRYVNNKFIFRSCEHFADYRILDSQENTLL